MSKSNQTPARAPLTLPRILLHLEGFAAMVVACALYGHYHFSLTWFAAAFLVPDLGMIGYLVGRKVGAASYNAVHTYLVPLAFLALVVLTGHRNLMWMPLVWIAHIGFDRALGYGLKYGDSFNSTHLGRV